MPVLWSTVLVIFAVTVGVVSYVVACFLMAMQESIGIPSSKAKENILAGGVRGVFK